MFTDPSAQHGGPSPPPLDSLRADSHRGWQGAQSSQAQWPQNDPGRKVGEVITAPAKVLWPCPWFHSRPFSLLPPGFRNREGDIEVVAQGRPSVEHSKSPKSTGCPSPIPKRDEFEV